MTRAEKAALEAYPPKFTTPKRRAKRIQSGKVDTHAPVRAIFRKAYEQGQQETIERAVEWLKDYIRYFELYDEKGIEEFRKAMEEEV